MISKILNLFVSLALILGPSSGFSEGTCSADMPPSTPVVAKPEGKKESKKAQNKLEALPGLSYPDDVRFSQNLEAQSAKFLEVRLLNLIGNALKIPEFKDGKNDNKVFFGVPVEVSGVRYVVQFEYSYSFSKDAFLIDGNRVYKDKDEQVFEVSENPELYKAISEAAVNELSLQGFGMPSIISNTLSKVLLKWTKEFSNFSLKEYANVTTDTLSRLGPRSWWRTNISFIQSRISKRPIYAVIMLAIMSFSPKILDSVGLRSHEQPAQEYALQQVDSKAWLGQLHEMTQKELAFRDLTKHRAGVVHYIGDSKSFELEVIQKLDRPSVEKFVSQHENRGAVVVSYFKGRKIIMVSKFEPNGETVEGLVSTQYISAKEDKALFEIWSKRIQEAILK